MLYLIVVFLATLLAASWLITRYAARGGGTSWTIARNKAEDDLDALFIENPKKLASTIIPISALILAIIGFLLPSGFSGINQLVIDDAMRLNKHGLYEQALNMLVNYQRSKSPLVYNEMGVSHLGMNNLEDAISNFKRATKLEPNYSQAHSNLAYAYQLMKEFTNADFEMRRAAEASKTSIDIDSLYGSKDEGLGYLFLRILFCTIFGLLGFKLAGGIISHLRKRRMQRFDKQLADTLGIMSNALQAGLSLQQSLEVVAKQMPIPTNQEFGLLLKEYQLGKSLEDAMSGLAVRMPTEDTKVLVNTTATLAETGGNLPEAFQNIAYIIRERQRVKEKILTMTAEGRAQAIIIGIIPFFLAWILNTFQPETFSLLYTTVLGWLLILAMALWGALGVFIMWKIMQVKI